MQPKQIKRKSFLFRFNTWWNFPGDLIGLEWPPRFENRRTRCQIFWFTIFSALLGWLIIFPIELALAAVLVVIAYGMTIPIAFLLGRKWSEDEQDFVPIEKLPRICGFKIYPIYLPALGVGTYLAAKHFHELLNGLLWLATRSANGLTQLMTWSANGFMQLLTWSTAISLLALCAVVIIAITVSVIRKTDAYKTLKVRLKEYCVPVEFVD